MANRTIFVIGGNLYQIALEYLGDATQWNRIAALSGTGTDPIIALGSITALTIPPRDSSATGGIYVATSSRPGVKIPADLFGLDQATLLGTDGAILTGPV